MIIINVIIKKQSVLLKRIYIKNKNISIKYVIISYTNANNGYLLSNKHIYNYKVIRKILR